MTFFDLAYLIIMAPVFILSIGAQWSVKFSYRKVSQYHLRARSCT